MIRLHHPSLSDTVREELVRLIVTGVLKPGQRLNEVHLAERLGVSRGPLREAARELEGQGLVVSRPRLGFYVVDFSASEIIDLYEVKVFIDQALIRDVMRYWTEDIRRDTLAEIDGIDRSAKLPFSRSLFAFREQAVARIHNRYVAEHALSLYRKFYIVTALIDVPDEAERIDRITTTLRRFWSALVAGDGDRARQIAEEDTAYWTRDLPPRFDAQRAKLLQGQLP
ncbi:MAG TPA: GntR family transcriptional regulator [Paracoccus sp. (in: a-proteobacteria)]|nr:GntR family transcriptional regulator [Paracoccus sp. (in: a-proteobacteria)]HMR37602.1 GntR family transcriptional regulator [Paracoccus sp. (in: a-proteobacteria)]